MADECARAHGHCARSHLGMKLFLAAWHLGACGLLADVGVLEHDLSMIEHRMMRLILLWITFF
jgi:hypothetical protein